MKTFFAAAIASVGLAVLSTAPGLAQKAGEFVSQEGPADSNVYLAGKNVSVNTEASDDVIAAGGEVTVRGRIAEDVLAAGGEVAIDAAIGDDLRVAGGNVTVRGSVAGDVNAAAGDLLLARGLTIGKKLMAAGGQVSVDAEVAGDATVAGSRIELGGTFRGNVEAIGEDIRVLPGAHIVGDFTYRSLNEATIAPEARIDGDITFIRSDVSDTFFGGAFAGLGAGTLFFLIGLVVLGAIHLLLFPNVARAVTRDMRDRPGRALLVGAAVFVGIPVLALLLAISFIGFPVTIFLAGAFLAALFAAYLSAALVVGQVLARLIRRDADSRFWPRVAALAVGLLVLAVAGLIPFVGPLITIAALMLGLGALAVQISRARDAAV
jgi:cytoskeletal protein CcmA (bactofilin family)